MRTLLSWFQESNQFKHILPPEAVFKINNIVCVVLGNFYFPLQLKITFILWAGQPSIPHRHTEWRDKQLFQGRQEIAKAERNSSDCSQGPPSEPLAVFIFYDNNPI